MRTPEIVGDRFVIEGLAASGGMGAVYRAHDRRTGRRVALKRMLTTSDGPNLARFLREAQILSTISHPQIVGYVAAGASDNPPWLAMEWLDGEDLAHRLSSGPLDVESTLPILRDLASALEHLHALGVVHRDLKPSNVMLVRRDGKNRACLLDLGIARPSAEDATVVTATARIIGTPLYMSPEQARGEPPTPQGDLWSLGVMAFEMLSGKPPFAAASPLAVLGKILIGDVPSLAKSAPLVPRNVVELVARALERDLTRRWESARALRAELDRLDGIPPTLPSLPPPSAVREQRVAFVVFAEASDDERDSMLKELRSQGADAEPVRGGFVVAQFGLDAVRPDTAIRAIRAVSSLRAGSPRVRIALALSRVGSAQSRGMVIERGAELLLGAAPGDVIADADVHAIVEDHFPWEQRGRAFALADEHAATSRTATHTVFVGRESELGRLEGLCREAFEERAPRGALVLGAPGLGKSRLLGVLRDRLASAKTDVVFLGARGDAVATASPYSTVAGALRALAGLDGTTETREATAQLAHLLERDLTPAAVKEHLPFVAEMVGVDPSPLCSARWEAARGAPETLRREIRRSFGTWARAVGSARSMIFAVDDAHWADEATMDLAMSLLVSEDVRCLVLLFGRPEVEGRFPQLASAHLVERVLLRSLSPKAAEKIVRAFATGAVHIDAIVSRAGGNPLFLRELARLPAQSELPASVQFVLQQRLDALPPSTREACRAAAAFGEVSWAEGVASVLGRNVDVDLSNLVAGEVLERRDPSSIVGHYELCFRHALLRDAADAMTVDADLRAFHAAVGRWKADHVRPRQPEALAYHAERAGEVAEAATLFAEAGAAAGRVHLPGKVVALTGRALELGLMARLGASRLVEWLETFAEGMRSHRFLGEHRQTVEGCIVRIDETGTADERTRSKTAAARVLGWARDYARALEIASELENLVGAESPARAQMLLETAHWALNQGRLEAVDAIVSRVEIASLPPERRLAACTLLASAAAQRGDRACFVWLDRAGEYGHGTPMEGIEIGRTRALCHYLLGDYERCADALLPTIEIARNAELHHQHAMNAHNVGDALMHVGRLEEARRYLEASSVLCRDHSFEQLLNHNIGFLARIDVLTGSPERLERLARSYRFAVAQGYTWDAMDLAVSLAEAHAHVGQEEAARRLLSEALGMAERWGNAAVARQARVVLARLDESTEPGLDEE